MTLLLSSCCSRSLGIVTDGVAATLKNFVFVRRAEQPELNRNRVLTGSTIQPSSRDTGGIGESIDLPRAG
jgi:hypothetical protein